MQYNSKKIKFIREKVKKVTQADMAQYLKMERGTYAAREAKGDFTPEEFALLLKKLKMSEGEFMQYHLLGDKPEISAHESMLRLEAYMKIALSVMAELLAKQNGSSVTATLNTLTKAVEGEYERLTNELVKSAQR